MGRAKLPWLYRDETCSYSGEQLIMTSFPISVQQTAPGR